MTKAPAIARLTMSADGKICGSEGGEPPGSIRAMLEEDRLDEIFITILPVIRGGPSAEPGTFLPASRQFRLKKMAVENNECRAHYVRRRARGV